MSKEVVIFQSEEKHSFEVELERKPGDEKQAGPLELG